MKILTTVVSLRMGRLGKRNHAVARTGFSLKQASRVLQIHERRVTQSLDPSAERLARLWRVSPEATLALIFERLDFLPPMTPEELQVREEMLEGRLDRNRIQHR